MKTSVLSLALGHLLLLTHHAHAQIEQGIAAGFPADTGIENHPSVIFVENFEESSISAMTQRWDEAQRPNHMSLSSDTPAGSTGKQSLSADGTEGGPSLFRQLAPGREQVYLRYYAKFDPTCSAVDHFAWIGGHNPATTFPWPRAGQKPSGSSHFSTGVEPRPTWKWDYYTYWQNMTCWGPDTSTQCHGNEFLGSAAKPDAKRGEWFSMELMVKLNTPVSASNGEQAFWINGQKWGHVRPGTQINGTQFPGFRWRSVDDLKINYLWMYMYTPSDAACRVWFDNVVVATEYIGPIRSSAQGNPIPLPPSNLTVN